MTVDGRKHECDLLVASGARQPAYSLLAQVGARVEYAPGRGIFVPTDLPAGVEVVGDAAGDLSDAARARRELRRRQREVLRLRLRGRDRRRT